MATYHVDPINGVDRIPIQSNAYQLTSGGVYILTQTKHDLSSGDQVELSQFTAWLNTIWTVTVLDDYSYILNGATWLAASDATGIMSYVTPTNHDGSTWALAKRDCNLLSLVAGDTVKIAKSPAPISIGNAAWEYQSKTVVLSVAQNKTIEPCTTLWTLGSSGNSVALQSDKSAAIRIQTKPIASIASNTIIGYKTLPSTLNLSAYQGITFWFNAATQIPADMLRVRLCSDNVGTVIVDEFIVTSTLYSNAGYCPYTLWKVGGGNLGSNINSIAVCVGTHYSSAIASKYMIWGKFSACKTNGLHLNTLITKNGNDRGGTEACYGIMDITEEVITLETGVITNLTSYHRGYSGVTETVETYIRIPFGVYKQMTPQGFITTLVSGTATDKVTYIGGYNTVSDIVDGETYIDGETYTTVQYGVKINHKYNEIYNISVARCTKGYWLAYSTSDGAFAVISFQDACSNESAIYVACRQAEIKNITNLCMNGGKQEQQTGITAGAIVVQNSMYNNKLYIHDIGNIDGNAAGIFMCIDVEFYNIGSMINNYHTIRMYNPATSVNGIRTLKIHDIGIIKDYSITPISIEFGDWLELYNITLIKNAVPLINISKSNKIKIYDITVTDPNTIKANWMTIERCWDFLIKGMTLINCARTICESGNSQGTIYLSDTFSYTNPPVTSSYSNSYYRIGVIDSEGNQMLCEGMNVGIIYTTDTMPEGLAGSLMIYNAVSQPVVDTPIGSVAFVANKLVTITFKIRPHGAVSHYHKIHVNDSPNLGISYTEAHFDATPSTDWQYGSISFTPTRKGAVSILYTSRSSGISYIADLRTFQAD